MTEKNNLNEPQVKTFTDLDSVQKELEKQAQESNRYINKEITSSHPFTGEFDPAFIKFENVEFDNGKEKKLSKVWKFVTVNGREFSTSNLKLSAEIVKNLKDGLTVLTIGKRPAVDKDGKELNQLIFYLTGATAPSQGAL